MIGSEVVAKLKKTKIQPSQPGKVFVIGNLIPFKNLNIVFAFGIIVRATIDIIWTTKYGLPKIAIQTTIMLLCLLLCNTDAKTYFKRRLSACRGVDMEARSKPEPTEPIPVEQVEMQDENHQGDDNVLQNEESTETADADQIHVVPVIETNYL